MAVVSLALFPLTTLLFYHEEEDDGSFPYPTVAEKFLASPSSREANKSSPKRRSSPRPPTSPSSTPGLTRQTPQSWKIKRPSAHLRFRPIENSSPTTKRTPTTPSQLPSSYRGAMAPPHTEQQEGPTCPVHLCRRERGRFVFRSTEKTGWIRDNVGNRYFAHAAESGGKIVRELNQGDEVEFCQRLCQKTTGLLLQATCIRKINSVPLTSAGQISTSPSKNVNPHPMFIPNNSNLPIRNIESAPLTSAGQISKFVSKNLTPMPNRLQCSNLPPKTLCSAGHQSHVQRAVGRVTNFSKGGVKLIGNDGQEYLAHHKDSLPGYFGGLMLGDEVEFCPFIVRRTYSFGNSSIKHQAYCVLKPNVNGFPTNWPLPQGVLPFPLPQQNDTSAVIPSQDVFTSPLVIAPYDTLGCPMGVASGNPPLPSPQHSSTYQ